MFLLLEYFISRIFDDLLAQRSLHWFMAVALAFAGSIPSHSIHLYWPYIYLPWSGRLCLCTVCAFWTPKHRNYPIHLFTYSKLFFLTYFFNCCSLMNTLGYDTEELVGRSLYDYHHAADSASLIQQFKSCKCTFKL